MLEHQPEALIELPTRKGNRPMSKAIGTASVGGISLAERDTHRIGTAVMTPCPSWCVDDVQLGNGVVLHSGHRAVIEVAATDTTDEHDLVLRAERIDRPGEVGPTIVTLTVDGAATVELPPAGLRALLQLGVAVAGQIGVRP